MKKSDYEDAIEPMQEELVAMARWARVTGQRIVVLFEGRDTAGKGGAIRAVSEKLNPRQCRTVALGKPTDDERGRRRRLPAFDALPPVAQGAAEELLDSGEEQWTDFETRLQETIKGFLDNMDICKASDLKKLEKKIKALNLRLKAVEGEKEKKEKKEKKDKKK